MAVSPFKRWKPRALHRLKAAGAVALALCLSVATGHAQTLIRDAEIEHSLKELAAPVLTAAGLSPQRVQIMIIADRELNAFIVDTQHIFIHSGLIREMDRPEMLQAVIAHEAAHIANGHITRRMMNARNAKTAAGLGLLLSGAIAVAGGGEAAGGIAAGTGSSARRVFLAHTRAEENSADQSAAAIMARAGIDPAAMVDVLEIFSGQEVLAPSRQDLYVRSHPLSRDRLRAAQGYAAAYKVSDGADPASAYWFARARAKLDAFLGNPGQTLRRLRNAENNSITLMQKAVAYHRIPDLENAIANMNALVRARPNDPYVHELKGQILFEGRQFREAVTSYAKAVELAPSEPLILAGYGQALLALDTADTNRRALSVLERAYALDPRQPRLLRDLAVANARAGNNGMASLATAERYALIGRLRDAGIHAERASNLLPRGTAGWNRAQDVLRAADEAGRQRR